MQLQIIAICLQLLLPKGDADFHDFAKPMSAKITTRLDRAVSRDLRRVYSAIVLYRRRHSKFPEGLDDLKKEFPRVGIRGSSHRDGYAFSIMTPRPDGSPRPAYPKPGERDFWAYWGSPITADERKEYSIVLWSNGTISKVMQSNIVLYLDPTDEPGAVKGFPGQTGYVKGRTFHYKITNGRQAARPKEWPAPRVPKTCA